MKLHFKKHHDMDLPAGLDSTPDAGIWSKPDPGVKSVTLTLIPPVIQLIRLIQRQNQADLPRCTEDLNDFILLAQAKLCGKLPESSIPKIQPPTYPKLLRW